MVKPPKSWLEEYNALHQTSSSNNGNNGSNGSNSRNNKKRPRGSFGTNMDNTFRLYMARKINLQRDQFGLVLPPPPPPLPTTATKTTNDCTTSATTTSTSLPSQSLPKSTTPQLLPKSTTPETNNSNSTTIISNNTKEEITNKDVAKKEDEYNQKEQQQHQQQQLKQINYEKKNIHKSVRFKEEQNEYYVDDDNDDDGRSHNTTTTESIHNNEGMNGVLNRLKRKHGFKTKSRRRSSISSSNNKKRRSSSSSSSSSSNIHSNYGVAKCNTSPMNSKTKKKEIIETITKEEEVDDDDEMNNKKQETTNEMISLKSQETIIRNDSKMVLGMKMKVDDGDDSKNDDNHHHHSNNDNILQSSSRSINKDFEMEEIDTVQKDPEHDIIKTSTINFDTSEDNPENNHESQSSQNTQPTTTTTTTTTNLLQLKRQRPDLFFLGITVMVNGYTTPCSDTIMRTLHRYGGNLEKYETTSITHIIAQHLSEAKAKIYKKQKNPIPVVYPKWIVDCVKVKRLLPYQDYLIDEVKDDDLGTTNSVKSYFKKGGMNSKSRNDGCGGGRSSSSANNHDVGSKSHSGITKNVVNSLVTKETMEMGKNHQEMPSNCIGTRPQQNKVDAATIAKITSPQKNNHTFNSDQNVTTNKARSKVTSPQKNDPILSSNDNDQSLQHIKLVASPQTSKNTSSSSPAKPPPPSTFSGPRTVGNDPNFLDSYFASSRLSFIGSFKQRVKSKAGNHIYNNERPRNRQGDGQKYIYHVDMDCFFAAIAIRNYPQYKNKPVAVGHAWKTDPNGVGRDSTSSSLSSSSSMQRRSISSNNKNSTSELSTCNYAARKFGVRKGMFAQSARKLCPDLVILPYDYEGYENASSKVAEILEEYSQEYHGVIEQVSCDEFYLELAFYEDDIDVGRDVKDVARDIGDRIRKDILNATECTASIGIGENKLLAKLATDRVKEREGNGTHLVHNVKSFLSSIKLRDLPGVGYRFEKKLHAHNLFSVCDVWAMGNDTELCSILGKGNGSKIYMYCQGLDTRPVKAAERKTIGAECNYGVRFNGPYGVDHMMSGLAKEVVKRMCTVGVKGKHMTVKVKERKENAPPPGKFNGHGKCNDHSKSINLPFSSAVRDVDLFCREGMKLFRDIGIHKDKVRGMGMVISKLENESVNESDHTKSKDNINQWLQKCSRGRKQTETIIDLENDSCSPDRETANNSDQAIQKLNSKLSNSTSDDDDEVVEVVAQTEYNSENIQLPPLEDISMDDVMALPLDLREKVLSMIKEIEHSTNSNTSFHSAEAKVIQSPISPRRTPKSPKRKKKSTVVPTKIIHSNGQVDMKRMMKLVAVKSGQDQIEYDGEKVSLTQLGHLPLDLQLQIANNDEVVMKKPPPLPQKPTKSKARKSLFCDNSDADESVTCHVESDDNIEVLSCDTESHEYVEECDIRYLRQWLQEHAKPSEEEVLKLKSFINICISERRLDDAVTYLRLIKRNAHSWQPNQFKNLVGDCNMYLLESQGRKLDLLRLGL